MRFYTKKFQDLIKLALISSFFFYLEVVLVLKTCYFFNPRFFIFSSLLTKFRSEVLNYGVVEDTAGGLEIFGLIFFYALIFFNLC